MTFQSFVESASQGQGTSVSATNGESAGMHLTSIVRLGDFCGLSNTAHSSMNAKPYPTIGNCFARCGPARPSSQESVRQCLHEPAVDDVALVGNRAGVVCGQEEGEPGNFLRLNLVLQRLALKNVGKELGGVPELLLPLGGDGAGENGVNADVEGAEIVGEGAGESNDGGLGGDIDSQCGVGNDPGDGAHIDNRPAARCAHGREDGLNGEEVRT